MRIVSGNLKGRIIHAPKGREVRPTGEKVRAAIFNILYSHLNLSESVVADICCGTGALGLEAISRGAKFCTFVDSDTKTISYNIKELGLENGFTVIRGLGQKVSLTHSADVIFLDPPYYNAIAEDIMKNSANIGHEGSIWVVEVESKHELEFNDTKFELISERKYGHSKIYILEQKG